MQEIKLLNTPDQLLDVTLEEVAYKFHIKWNHRGAYYTVDVLTKEGTIIVGGMKLALNATILRNHPGYGLPPGEIVIVDSSGNVSDIVQNDLEERVAVIYATEAEYVAL